jgi:hypothetical protein
VSLRTTIWKSFVETRKLSGAAGARLAPAAAAPPVRARADLPKPAFHSHLLRLGPAALRFGGGCAALGAFVVGFAARVVLSRYCGRRKTSAPTFVTLRDTPWTLFAGKSTRQPGAITWKDVEINSSRMKINAAGSRIDSDG